MKKHTISQPAARRKRKRLAWIGILLLLIIGVFAALPLFTPPVETLVMDDAARAGTDGEYVALSDGIVHYETAGPEGAPTVIFIHGVSMPYFVWDSNFPIVADAGYRAVRYDLYGRGYSDYLRRIRYDADLFDRQLLELVIKLTVKTPVTLVGFSLGGDIAVIFAERHPELVNGLVLVSPGGFPLMKAGEKLFWNFIRLPGVGEYFIRLAGKKMADPENQGSDLFDQALLPGYIERFKGLERYKGTLSAWLSTIRHFPIVGLESSFRAVGDSHKPVLLVWCKEDRAVPFATTEKVKAVTPQAELLAIELAGHASHYEKRDLVNAAILNFLQRITPIS